MKFHPAALGTECHCLDDPTLYIVEPDAKRGDMDMIKTHDIDVSGARLALPTAPRDIRMIGDLIVVLLDPDVYLAEPSYQDARRAGGPALRNLQAFSLAGEKIWEAEMPEAADYYYEITSDAPIAALSFSGYRCELDAANGRITDREFLK
jgi:hypothetical protein